MDPNGVVIDGLTFGPQTGDISYARYPDGRRRWVYSAHPTPGDKNDSPLLEPPRFSCERGFYDMPFYLELETDDPDAAIYYTTDGSLPYDPGNDSSSARQYTQPILITETTTVRAQTVRPGCIASRVRTHTFILDASEAIKSLPVIALVGDEENTFYEPNGVMAIVGGCYDEDTGKWQPAGPNSYNNALHRGRQYERPVSLEIMDVAKQDMLQADCGIRVRGSNHSRQTYTRGHDWLTCLDWPYMRNLNKFSFNLFFRNIYGRAQLDYAFFPFVDVQSYNSIALRGGKNDMCTPFITDEWARRLFVKMGHVQVTGCLANLYINAEYKGPYNPCGRTDEEFLQQSYNTDNSFDIITSGEEVRSGDNIAWNKMYDFIAVNDLADPAAYEHIGRIVDIPSFVDYLILQIYLSNADWPGNNYECHRERSESGKWRFSIWDAEQNGGPERTAFEHYPRWSWKPGLNHMDDPVSKLYRALKANADFRQLFADRVHKHFRNNGVLTESRLLESWWRLADRITPILQELDRYLSLYFPERFIPVREQYVLQAFEDNDLFDTNLEAPTFEIDGQYQHGGRTNINAHFSMEYQQDSGTVYYTLDGSDPRLPGGAVNADHVSVYSDPFNLTASTVIKARIRRGDDWSPLNQAVYNVGPVRESLRITELMFHPHDIRSKAEFIELKNIGAESINLNLVKFTNGVRFTFGDFDLACGEYALVVRDLDAFEARYGSDLNVAGVYEGRLDNGGERVELQDAAGTIIHSFRYRDGWYDIADGHDFSLTVNSPETADPLDYDSKSNWRPSAAPGGTPGDDDAGVLPRLGAIRINEVLAHSHAAASDWIELHNTTDQVVNIGGWFLSDSDENFRKYEIAPGTVIDPCDFIVFYESSHFGNPDDPGARKPFALSENGEKVFLHSGSAGTLTGYVEEEDFGASETGVSFGRYKKSTGTYNFVPMAANTPGSPNAMPKVGPIVINEIMYHPAADGDAEYIELHNISGAPLTLQDWDNQQGLFVPWLLEDSGGLEFHFPLETTIPQDGYLLLVKDLSEFVSAYGPVPTGTQAFEWGDGKLDNGGEKLQLSRPGDLDPDGSKRYYIRVDRVNYSDGSHPEGSDPWPASADGSGDSLSRIDPAAYGNDFINFKAATPTAGQANF